MDPVGWLGYRWCQSWDLQLLEWLHLHLNRLHLSYHPRLTSVVTLFHPLQEHYPADCSYDVDDNIAAVNPVTHFFVAEVD